MGVLMHYVYLLQSASHPGQRYVGFTADLKKRFKSHNEGASIYTAKYKPWELIAYNIHIQHEGALLVLNAIYSPTSS